MAPFPSEGVEVGSWTIRVAAGAAAALSVAAAATGSWWLSALAAVLALVALAASVGGHAAPARTPLPVTPEAAPPPLAPPSADTDVVVSTLYSAAVARVPAVSAHLWLEDQPTATLRSVAVAGPRLPSGAPLGVEDPVVGRALTTGSAVLEATARVRTEGGDRTLWRFAVPVGSGDARGVAAVDVECADGAPDAAALTEVTAGLRAALTGALALHVARAETETARVLLAAAKDLSSRLRPEDVVARALDRAMELSHAATGSVMLMSEDGAGLRIAGSRGLPDEVVAETLVRPHEGIAGWVFASGTSMLVEDLPGRPASRRHGVRSAMSVPISDEHGTLGVINVGSRAFPARFTDAHLRSLESLGSQAAVALRNATALTRSRDLYLASLQALAAALEMKDPYSIGAAGRVADIAIALAESMRLEPTEVQSIQVASILHDIGMGMAAGALASSARPLSTIDRGLLRAHPRVAAEVLTQLPALEAVVPIVYHHHEHFDGHGYDAGIGGEDIPVGARILAVADAFVAMTGERPYRAAMTVKEALNELSAKSGSQFDPEVVAALKRLLTENPDLALTAR